MAFDAASFMLRLEDRMSAPAGAAGRALAMLEAKIAAQRAALEPFEEELKKASLALHDLENPSSASHNAAIDKQTAAVAKLQARLEETKAKVAALQEGGGDPEGLKKAENYARLLQGQLTGAKAKLEALQKSGPAIDKGAIEAQKKVIADLEAKMKPKQGALDTLLGGVGKFKSMADAEAKAAAFKQGVDNLQGAMAQAGGPLGEFGAKLGMLRGLLASPIGVAVALAAAIVALGVAFVATTVHLASFALEVTGARRALSQMMAATAPNAAAAQANAEAVGRVAKSVAIARPELEEMARTLAVAGLSGKLFEDTLRQLAVVASVAGPQAAGKIEEIVKKSKGLGHFQVEKESLAGLGISMADLAKQLGYKTVPEMEAAMKAGKVSVEKGIDAMNKALGKRFGSVAKDQMLNWQVQLLKFKENIAGLFEGVNVKPFLEALQKFLRLFDSSTATGKAMKTMIEGFLNGVFRIAANALPTLEVALKIMIITALRTYIALKPIARLFEEIGKNSGGVGEVGSKLEALSYIIQGVLEPFRQSIDSARMLFQLYNLVAAGIDALIERFFGLGEASNAAGAAVGDGFVNGLTEKIGAAVAAASSLGQGALDALRAVLGVASPSRKAHEVGGYTAEGFTGGVEAGSGDAQGALKSMAALPAPSGGGRRGGGNTYNVTINGVSGADEMTARTFIEMLADELEGRALQQT